MFGSFGDDTNGLDTRLIRKGNSKSLTVQLLTKDEFSKGCIVMTQPLNLLLLKIFWGVHVIIYRSSARSVKCWMWG